MTGNVLTNNWVHVPNNLTCAVSTSEHNLPMSSVYGMVISD